MQTYEQCAKHTCTHTNTLVSANSLILLFNFSRNWNQVPSICCTNNLCVRNKCFWYVTAIADRIVHSSIFHCIFVGFVYINQIESRKSSTLSKGAILTKKPFLTIILYVLDSKSSLIKRYSICVRTNKQKTVIWPGHL